MKWVGVNHFSNMVEKMKKLKRLAIILLVGTLTSLAQAMDVAPLYFVDAQGNRIAANLQQEYWNYLTHTAGCVPEWFFPGRKITDPIGRSTVDSIFTVFWNKTAFAASCDTKPTVHDLRHSYVIERINTWMAQGLDFDQMLPYLSRFLGHKTFNETYYYYHYVEEAAKTIQRLDKTASKVIPEVMRR